MTSGLGDSAPTSRGLPPKRAGESFGSYLQRITPEQEFAMSKAARFIGVVPRSIFEFYIPGEAESGDHAI